MASLALCLVCYSVLCGKDLWIPASRIGNLHARAIVLSVCDAAASFSDYTGLSGAVPSVKSAFVSIAGLQGNSSWDTRYFNRREAGLSVTDVRNPASFADGGDAVGSGTVGGDPAIAGGTGISAIPVDGDAPASAAIESASPEAPVAEGDIAGQEGQASPTAPAKEVKADEHYQSTGKTLAMDSSGSRSLVFSTDNPLEMYMFGDSQVFSLGSGLSRLVGKDGMIKVDYLAIHSSGFIRGDYYDWPGKLADTFSGRHYSAAIVMLGMNDYQNFRGKDGKILKKTSPEWESVYREKCRNIIDLVLEEVPRVYWLGMPRVKNKVYDESLRYIDRVQQSVVEEYSPDLVTRIAIMDYVPGKGKSYSDSIVDPKGRQIRVMSEDGTHFTVDGGQFAMKPLFDRIAGDYEFAENPVAHLPE